jgi:glycine hydroxymethyltransferase
MTVNKNAVPNDPRPPAIASGLRIGTPASTTRGFREREIEQVADMIADVLDAEGADGAVERAREQALDLCRRFPVYGP